MAEYILTILIIIIVIIIPHFPLSTGVARRQSLTRSGHRFDPRPGRNFQFKNLKEYVELIAIHLIGTLILAAPLVLFDKSRYCRNLVSPLPFFTELIDHIT